VDLGKSTARKFRCNIFCNMLIKVTRNPDMYNLIISCTFYFRKKYSWYLDNNCDLVVVTKNMISCQQIGLMSILSILVVNSTHSFLYTSGIFPSKCALVPPREITKEELLMVRGLQVLFLQYRFSLINQILVISRFILQTTLKVLSRQRTCFTGTIWLVLLNCFSLALNCFDYS